jgi:hypothetical protein
MPVAGTSTAPHHACEQVRHQLRLLLRLLALLRQATLLRRRGWQHWLVRRGTAARTHCRTPCCEWCGVPMLLLLLLLLAVLQRQRHAVVVCASGSCVWRRRCRVIRHYAEGGVCRDTPSARRHAVRSAGVCAQHALHAGRPSHGELARELSWHHRLTTCAPARLLAEHL